MAIISKGSEPANLKKRMDTLFAKLDEAYPDKVICGLQQDHKHWSETVRELYRALGYPDGDTFLNAYGYTVSRKDAGRPKTNNYDEVIAELRSRYPEGMPFSKISEITTANPDLKGVLKSMQNNAVQLYGMGLKEYFNQIGLFGLGDKKSQVDDLIAKLQQRYPEGTTLPKTVAKLKADNQDLPMNRLTYIKNIYGADVKDYLTDKGLIQGTLPAVAVVAGDSEETQNEAYLRLLAQRYTGKAALPVTLTDLANANPDIPVRRLNKYLREKGEKKAEHYYIRNRILQGKPTDLEEFTYCMVSFGNTANGTGSRPYSYLAGNQTYAAGDPVIAEFGFSGWSIGTVTEVIRCLGIDAPWPVSQSKEILRKARPDEIAAGLPQLTAEEQRLHTNPADRWNIVRRSPIDNIPDTDTGVHPDGSIPGFIPGDQDSFRFDCTEDFRHSNWFPCEFRFRGLLPEISKLKQYIRQQNIHASAAFAVSDQIWEIWVIAEEKTMDLIEKFPALKVTGLIERWFQQEVYTVYSGSGFPGISEMAFGGYFDRRQEGGDARWEWEYDMMQPIHVKFEWMQTGEPETVSYRYPFAAKWNDTIYTREENGLIYVKKPENNKK